MSSFDTSVHAVQLQPSPVNVGGVTDIRCVTTVQNQGVRLRVYTYGEHSNTPVVLVHGYPDNHGVWTAIAEGLSKQFFVIIYDVRGAGESDAPQRLSDYRMPLLASDLQAIVETQIGTRDFHLVGHDWGSIQSWESVTTGPLKARIKSFTSISGPCLDHVGCWLKDRSSARSISGMRDLLKQATSSWYIGAFHLPGLASGAWRNGLAKLWPYYLKYREGVAEPEANPTQGLDGERGIQLYRANIRQKLFKPEARHADCPVQLIVPTQDNYVGTHLFDDLHQWVPNLYRRELQANHWVLLSHPQRITAWIAEFVSGIEQGAVSHALRLAKVRPHRQHLPLHNKCVVITGAGSGIGRACAHKFAQSGANIVCVDMNRISAELTVEECREYGGYAWARAIDVGSAHDMQALAEWVEQDLGGADIVINNAGIGMAGGLLETSNQDWHHIMNVNLWGVIYGSRLFAQQMVKLQRPGSIINVASAAAFAPNRKLAAYSTSKAAVHMLSECMRGELADKGIGVTAICPGFVATGIAKNTVYAGLSDAEQTRKRAKADALYKRRNFSPDDVAQAILEAVFTNPALVLVGAEAWTTRLLSRFAPALTRQVARLDITP